MQDPSAFPLEALYQDAQDKIREVDAAAVPDELNQRSGCRLAFYVYPRARALS